MILQSKWSAGVIVRQQEYFECQVPPMGIKPATDIFQSCIVGICMLMKTETKPNHYIGDVFHSKGKAFKEHLAILDEILFRLGEAGMQATP